MAFPQIPRISAAFGAVRVTSDRKHAGFVAGCWQIYDGKVGLFPSTYGDRAEIDTKNIATLRNQPAADGAAVTAKPEDDTS